MEERSNVMINIGFINPHYYYPEGFRNSAERFFNAYELETERNSVEHANKTFKDRKDRVCRFCNKKSPYVSFYKKAHIVSEFLGNKTDTSDFECDDCNLKFAKYETELASYLGIVRTVQSVKGKKVPKFKSAGKNMVAESVKEDDLTNIVKFTRYDALDKTFEFDNENNQNIIHYTKPPYVPLMVFKAFVKMALSIIDEKYLKSYHCAFDYIGSSKFDDHFTGFAILTRYTMPLTFQYGTPNVMIFKKKEPACNLFTHVFVLYALNSIFQIALPFYDPDQNLYKAGTIDTHWCPPIFGRKNFYEIGSLTSLSFNLNSTEKVYNEKESLTIPVQPGDLEISRFENAETGEITERKFDGDKIISIQLMMQEINEDDRGPDPAKKDDV
jgi:hypothetical protein